MRRIFSRAVVLATAAVLFDGALAQPREPEYHCTRHFYNQSSFEWRVEIGIETRSLIYHALPGQTVELHYPPHAHSILVLTVIPHTNQRIFTNMRIVRDGMFGAFRACPRIDIDASMVTAPWFDVNRPAAGDIRTCIGNC
jgi:hypothetical protein